MIDIQSPLPLSDYKALSWNVVFGLGHPNVSEKLMVDKERQVAERLLDIVGHNREYCTAIKGVSYLTHRSPETSEWLREQLWRNTRAFTWIAPRDAHSHNDLLWQFAVVRLSRYLNTGTWESENRLAIPFRPNQSPDAQ